MSLETSHTFQPHVWHIKTIISINSKETFIRTNHHVIIHSQLVVMSHNATTITCYTSCTYQLCQHLCISANILNKIIGENSHIMKLIKHSTSLHNIMLNILTAWHNQIVKHRIYDIGKPIPYYILGEVILSTQSILLALYRFTTYQIKHK